MRPVDLRFTRLCNNMHTAVLNGLEAVLPDLIFGIDPEKLAVRLMSNIKQVIPVLPISLVATVMRQTGAQGLSAFEVEAHVNQLIEKLQDDDVPVYITSKSRVQTILDGLNMLKLRHLVVESDGIYKFVPEEYDVLSYYANSIVHWLKDS